MAKLKQSISCWCFDREDLPLEKLCREAKRIGYEGLEMAPEDRWDAVIESGLRLVTDRGHASITEGLNRKENHARIEAELKAAIDKAAQRGMAGLICFSGNRGGMSDEEGIRNTAAGLKRVASLAERKGVTLLLELLNSKVDHKDYQCDRTEWGVRVVRQVASPRVKLLYDIYHMQIMEGDLVRTITDNVEWIGHFHTGGNPGRNEIDGVQEINYPAVIRAIAASGYAGFVGQEFIPTRDPIRSLEEAFAVCSVG